jgi:hypothetical protein
VPWDRPFAEPVELPKGKKLVTLRDAALYITAHFADCERRFHAMVSARFV